MRNNCVGLIGVILLCAVSAFFACMYCKRRQEVAPPATPQVEKPLEVWVHPDVMEDEMAESTRNYPYLCITANMIFNSMKAMNEDKEDHSGDWKQLDEMAADWERLFDAQWRREKIPIYRRMTWPQLALRARNWFQERLRLREDKNTIGVEQVEHVKEMSAWQAEFKILFHGELRDLEE